MRLAHKIKLKEKNQQSNYSPSSDPITIIGTDKQRVLTANLYLTYWYTNILYLQSIVCSIDNKIQVELFKNKTSISLFESLNFHKLKYNFEQSV